jgi:inhibitor of KinA sporulation pathway (predicted exonuclease)
MNGKDITKDNYKLCFLKQLKSAFKLVEKQYPDLKNLENEDIYNLIDEYNAALFVHDDFSETPSHIDVLKILVSTNAYAFYLELFKYACYNKQILCIILVYDDIEGIIETDTMFLFVRQACRIHVCLLNTEDRKFYATSIMYLRPSTRKVFQEAHWYNAYTANSQLIIDEPVALSEIFHARIEFLTQHEFRDNYTDKDRIKNALQVLEKVLERLEVQTLSIIALLSKYDIREALRLMATILANRKYVKLDTTVSQHFSVSPKDFVLNGGTILKSLVYDESDLYFDHNPYVFNLFNNALNPIFLWLPRIFVNTFFTETRKNGLR